MIIILNHFIFFCGNNILQDHLNEYLSDEIIFTTLFMTNIIKETCLKNSFCEYKNIIFTKLMKLLCNNTNINNEKKIYKDLVYDSITYIYFMNYLYRYIIQLHYNKHEDFIDQFIK